MDITKDLLIADGWIEKNDPPIFMEKGIENRNPLNSDPEDSSISLVLHGMYNTHTFAVMFPSGAMLNFVAGSMEELRAFEAAIEFYDPEY